MNRILLVPVALLLLSPQCDRAVERACKQDRTLPICQPSPRPTPTASPMPSPSPTAAPEPSPAPAPTPAPTPEPTPRPKPPKPTPAPLCPPGCSTNCEAFLSSSVDYKHLRVEGAWYCDSYGVNDECHTYYDNKCNRWTADKTRIKQTGAEQGFCTPCPTPSTSPLPTPGSPIPTPGSPGVSDVAKVRIFHYDPAGECKTPGQPFVMPSGCSVIHVTATPKSSKDADGDGRDDDAVQHGRRLTWRANGTPIPDDADALNVGCASITAGPNEMTFNRTINGPVRCPFVLSVELIAPDGVVHRHAVTVR